MPSTDNVMLFVSPTKAILAWAKTQLEAIVSIADVTIFDEHSETLLWTWVLKATNNQCAIHYNGSRFNNDGGPRRTLGIDIYVVYRYMTSINIAQAASHDLLDAVIAKLDHEGDAGPPAKNYIFKAISDKGVDFPNAGLTVYKVSFEVEDY